ncbi:MAG: S8 family serine peptidase [Chthoniobacterales bacterium]
MDELVSSNLALKQAGPKRAKLETFTADNGKVYATQSAAWVASDAITADDGRIMVRAHLSGLLSLDEVSKAIAARVPSFTTTAVDGRYKGGVIEGLVSIDDVPALAYASGVRSVALDLKPQHNKAIAELGPVGGKRDPVLNATPGQVLTPLGTAFDQGVFQHRVDQINKYYNPSAALDYEGSGMNIGFISDSFNRTTPNAPTDVANFDLPGAAGNPVNTNPVVVLQEYLGSGATDEGRGMGQIIYKMAPKARIAFATADNGEVGFGNNIRALAGLPGFTYDPSIQQGFAADTICDDVGYSDEPFFEDGIVGNAVDDVFAAGVSYFSSAGNDIGTYDYDSDYRNVQNGTGLTAAAGNTALAGTNINLANVPAGLYAGGFHNFRTDGGLDVAQTVNVIAGTGLPQTNFQWDDPYNQTVPVITPAIYHASGVHPGSGQQTYVIPNSLTVGGKYVLNVTAPPGSSFDAIVTLKDPSNVTVINQQDTGTDETLQFTATTSTPGYTVIVESFGGTTGAYNVDLYNAAPAPGVTTDFNILVFDINGNYLPNSSLVTNNISSNAPFEFRRTSPATGQTQVQYVISRSNNPPASPQPATHLRWIIRGNGASGIGPAEYITINTPNTKGHAMARGCNGTAAYSVFRPSMQEYFTSPGPATVYFDKLGNRLTPPDVRLQPRIAAADAGNTSFFGSDSTSDLDTKQNFSGTSAAAPHAAAIAALVLEAHGGHGSVTPAQMMNLLQRSTFIHDLDPYAATGVARTTLGAKVSIRVDADRGLNPSSGAFNPNSITVSYIGAGTLSSLVFNPAGTAATGGAPTAGNNGLGNAAGTADGNIYFSNIYPGIVFQPLPTGGRTSGTFVFGNGSVGLTAADVVPTFSNLAPLPSNGTNQFWTMTLTFPNNNFAGGNILRFTTGHAQQHDSTVTVGLGPTGGVTGVNTTQADLFGGAVLIPDGTITTNGLSFSGTTSGGGVFSGTMQNRLGAGWTPVDGFGFINAEAAVMAPIQ